MTLIKLILMTAMFLGALVFLGPVYAQDATPTPTATATATPTSPDAAPSTGFGPGI